MMHVKSCFILIIFVTIFLASCINGEIKNSKVKSTSNTDQHNMTQIRNLIITKDVTEGTTHEKLLNKFPEKYTYFDLENGRKISCIDFKDFMTLYPPDRTGLEKQKYLFILKPEALKSCRDLKSKICL